MLVSGNYHSNLTGKISQRRGIEHSDSGYDIVLVKFDYVNVLKAVMDMVGASVIDTKAYGEEFPKGQAYLVVYRLQGHGWTIIDPPVLNTILLQPMFARELSKQVEGLTLHYRYNTNVGVSFSLYQKGELVQRFIAGSPEEECEMVKYSDHPFSDDEFFDIELTTLEMEAAGIEAGSTYSYPFYAFPDKLKEKLRSPKIREMFVKDTSNFPARFVNLYLTDFDLYIPPVSWCVFSTNNHNLVIEGLDNKDFEYFTCFPCFKDLP